MKISTHLKENGDEVLLNMPLFPADYRIASVLFEKNKKLFTADVFGGPAFPERTLSPLDEPRRPDYDLYPLNDFSLGYTYRPCFRGCSFCKVSKMKHPDINHHSIWEFHNTAFKEICILNNNTFMDPDWKETFDEILDADLIVIDENGYDLRLLDDEKAEYLKRIRFKKNKLGFAWDRIEDEKKIVEGLTIAKRYGLLRHETNVYILCGYDTTEEENIHRCEIVANRFNARPYIMPFTESVRRFKRFMDTFMWRKYKTIKEAWNNYSA